MRPARTLSLSSTLARGGVVSARFWLPRRTGTVVMVAVLTLVDVLAALLVLSVLGALATLGAPRAANTQSLTPPIAVYTGRVDHTFLPLDTQR